MRKLIALLALIALAAPAAAQQLQRGSPLVATSGTVAAATAAATLATGDARTAYLCGFSVSSLGATAASTVTLTVTGIGATFSYLYSVAAGATVKNADLFVNFNPCIAAVDGNTPIVVSLPSLGAGNTTAIVNAWGYRN